jgi:hypothetical protein
LPSATSGKRYKRGKEGQKKKDEENASWKLRAVVVLGEMVGNVPVHDRTMLPLLQLEVVEGATGLKSCENGRKGGRHPLVQVEVVSEEVVDGVLRHAVLLALPGKWREKREIKLSSRGTRARR